MEYLSNRDQEKTFSVSDKAKDDDLRGCEVYDKDHQPVGIISEIYCDQVDLTAKYIEVVPYSRFVEDNYLLPFDSIKWWNGSGYLYKTWNSLSQVSEYRLERGLKKFGKSLVSYDQVLDFELNNFRYLPIDSHYAA